MFRKASNILFKPKRRYKTVASREIEIPFYRSVGQQRGRGFNAFAQVNGRTAIPFLRKYIRSAKRVGADLFEFAFPEIAEVVSGRKNFKTAAKSVGRQTLRKQLCEGSRRRKEAVGGKELAYGKQGGGRRRSASRFIPTKSVKPTSRSRRNNFTNTSD